MLLIFGPDMVEFGHVSMGWQAGVATKCDRKRSGEQDGMSKYHVYSRLAGSVEIGTGWLSIDDRSSMVK